MSQHTQNNVGGGQLEPHPDTAHIVGAPTGLRGFSVIGLLTSGLASLILAKYHSWTLGLTALSVSLTIVWLTADARVVTKQEQQPLSGWLMEAWATAPKFGTLQLPPPRARMPCLALRCFENGLCSARTFRSVEPGEATSIKAGCHSFVRVPGEDFIRISKIAFPFGTASGHGILSDEKPMLFAGEIEVDADGQLTRWNNISGTYKFPVGYAAQAKLPLDKFWGLTEDVPIGAEDLPDWMFVSSSRLWLHKSVGYNQ